MDEELADLSPVHFFQVGWNCGKKMATLPRLTPLLDQQIFANVAMCWSEKGLFFEVDVEKPLEECFYPEISKGDAVELMIDTRDVKRSGYNTRFCHHFFFLPQKVNEHQWGEITRFRTDDKHLLCDSHQLKCSVTKSKERYRMKIFLPKEVLHGFEPGEFKRLGLTYRISRFGGEIQEFSCASADVSIEEQPSLWSSVELV